jgi:hypothetical protein
VTTWAPPATGLPDVLVSSYEDLRSVALGRSGGSNRGVGLALFMRSGMAAWMEEIGAGLARIPEPRPRRQPDQTRLPADLRVDVAMVLAAMALSAHNQGAMTP